MHDFKIDDIVVSIDTESLHSKRKMGRLSKVILLMGSETVKTSDGISCNISNLRKAYYAERVAFEQGFSNISDIDNTHRLEVGECYKVTYKKNGMDMHMIGTPLDSGSREFTEWRSKANYISTSKEEFRREKSWCYKDRSRYYEKASATEKAWFEFCQSQNKYIKFQDYIKKNEVTESREDKEDCFPASGFFKGNDKTILKFLGDKGRTDLIKKFKKEEFLGVCWNKYFHKYHGENWNIWTVRGFSSKKEYSKEELLELIPERYKKEDDFIQKVEDVSKYYNVNLIQETKNSTGIPELNKAISKGAPISFVAGIESRRKAENYIGNWVKDVKLLEDSRHIIDHYRENSFLMQAQNGSRTAGKLIRDKFAQQKPVVRKSKKKKRKLIIC